MESVLNGMMIKSGYDTIRVRSETRQQIEAVQLRLRSQGRKVTVSEIIDAAMSASSGRAEPRVDVSALDDDQISTLRVIAQVLARGGELADLVRNVARLFSLDAKKRK